jgi:hypothetical protein
MPVTLELANPRTGVVVCHGHVGLVKRFHSVNAKWLLSLFIQ